MESFQAGPSADIFKIVYEKKLSISVLNNGTRRWYISKYFTEPPQDHSYFRHYQETCLNLITDLLKMLIDHGIYRIYIPVYSWHQLGRSSKPHELIMNTISKIRTHPRLKELYQERRCEVRFYGDTSYLPVEFANITDAPVNPFEGPPNHIIYFGLESKSPHDYSLKLAHQFILKNNRPPTWEDMVELYYGNRMVKPLDIMIGYNRIYARTGIPHLLEGYDRIYVTAVTPLVLSQTAFRKILYDYLYNHQDAGRDYKEIDPKELKRSRLFNEANKDTVTGLTRKYENLVYPLPGIVWPTELE